MTDVMIDLETLGNESDAVVLSIGAVAFDTTALALGPTFYRKLKIQDQLDKGRKINESTLRWWLDQDPKIFKEAMSAEEDPNSFLLVELDTFLMRFGSKVKVWGNGSTFDISIMESLYKTYGMKEPWNYSAAMDLRTFKRFVGKGKDIPKSADAHNALVDAIAQANYVLKCLKANH